MAAGAILSALARRRFARYALTGDSMAPALAPGDYLIVDTCAYAWCAPSAGEIALARDPRDHSRVIAKRVAAVAGDRVTLLGDNPAASTDSRDFGPVPRADLAGRAVWRYWPPARAGPLRALASCVSTSASVGKASSGGEAGSK